MMTQDQKAELEAFARQVGSEMNVELGYPPDHDGFKSLDYSSWAAAMARAHAKMDAYLLEVMTRGAIRSRADLEREHAQDNFTIMRRNPEALRDEMFQKSSSVGKTTDHGSVWLCKP